MKSVEAVFHSVAPHYDLMNDLMSLGLHRLWKCFALSQTRLHPGDWALDVATGTCDLVPGLLHQVGPTGRVVACDPNEAMLERGRLKLLNQGLVVDCIQASVEALPFDAVFHTVTMAFGLRNTQDIGVALRSLYNVLRPGGTLVVLEFSKPSPLVAPLYALQAKLIPWLGRRVAHDEESYHYLVDSIARHPDQATLRQKILDAGFAHCEVYNLSGGIVALHRAFHD